MSEFIGFSDVDKLRFYSTGLYRENNAVELLDGNGQVIAKVDGKTGKSSVAVDVKGDLIGYVDVKDGDGVVAFAEKVKCEVVDFDGKRSVSCKLVSRSQDKLPVKPVYPHAELKFRDNTALKRSKQQSSTSNKMPLRSTLTPFVEASKTKTF